MPQRFTSICLTPEFRDQLKDICEELHISYERLIKNAMECYFMFVEHELVDEKGESKAVILSDEDLHDIGIIARRTGLTKSQVVSYLIFTLKFIFEDRLTLSDIIAKLMRERGIPREKLQVLSP